ncbi:MAG: WG repeat-containing protein [Saprospiraceae bacterium]
MGYSCKCSLFPQVIGFLCCLFITLHVPGQAQGVLPIYSSPMVFLDSLGKVVGTLPPDYVILNTPNGKFDNGYVKGLAGNAAGEEGLIPAKNFDSNNITLFDETGKAVVNLYDRYNTVTPCYNGFHLAVKITKEGYFDTTTYYYLDKSGTQVFSPNGYEKATIFNDGMAAVRKGNTWMYINELGHELKLIDTSIHSIVDVSPFYEGLSRIQLGPGKKCEFETCYNYIFIDKKGEIKIDTRILFPDKSIKRMYDIQEGMSRVIFYPEDDKAPGDDLSFVSDDGTILCMIRNVFRSDNFNLAHTPVVTLMRTADGSLKSDSVFLLTSQGNRILLDDSDGYIAYEVFHLDRGIFLVNMWNDKKLQKGIGKLYDASAERFVYETRDDEMGVRWDLISLRRSSTKRYYVINYKTNKIVYDTEIALRNYSSMKEALLSDHQVTEFECDDPAELKDLVKLTSLEKLTLQTMDVTTLPSDFNPPLKLLRIDGLKKLTKLPDRFTQLEKLSLRNCPSVTNLFEVLEKQTRLKELFIINFGLTSEEEQRIVTLFPNVMITISGTKKDAYYQVQEVIEGF